MIVVHLLLTYNIVKYTTFKLLRHKTVGDGIDELEWDNNAMSRHASVTSSAQPSPRRPSLAPRRSSLAASLTTRSIGRRVSALSLVEQGEVDSTSHVDQVVAEEIDEIKRYEDFTTIDWVRDAAREQQRRKAKRQEQAGFFEREGGVGWRRKLWESYDAAQGWIVVSLIGAAIGLNAAFLNIVTEWLSDIKLGYCTTAFYLNESFCCWGAEEGWCTPNLSTGARADRHRLRRVASLEFSYCCQLRSIHLFLGTLANQTVCLIIPCILMTRLAERLRLYLSQTCQVFRPIRRRFWYL